MFSLFSRRKDPEIVQLRTPSPSIDSASVGKNNSPKQAPPITPSPPPEDDLGLITDPQALHALISSVPPKILYEYTLSHLIPPATRKQSLTISPPSARTLTHLTSFFSSLAPPPKLHCIRCHKDFYDVENNDRSCLVPHDDDSAEVERVGRSKSTETEYETLWGCCGKTVEGDGGSGPPEGWCYEGKHTTDPKRARFRADSTIHEDKLVSCERMRCNDPPSSSASSESSVTSAPRRKKPVRKPKAPASTQDIDVAPGEGSEQEQDDDARSVASSKGKRKAPTVTKAPRRKRARKSVDDKPYVQPKDVGDDESNSDVEMDDATPAKRRVKKPRSRKPKSEVVKPPSSDKASPGPPPSHSAPGSPGKSAMASSSGQKKSKDVSFSIDQESASNPPVRKRTKKLSEVVSSSIDGER